MYGVPYLKDMVVDDALLESKEFAKKFEQITGNPEVDAKLYEAAKHALERNSGKGTESLTLIDLFDPSKTVTVDCIGSHGVVYSEEVKAFIAERQDGEARVVALHNHPNGMPPSLDDFSKASENNYYLGVAVGHNGQVYTYQYHGRIYSTQECDDINDSLMLYLDMGIDVDRAFRLVLGDEGLSYELR